MSTSTKRWMVSIIVMFAVYALFIVIIEIVNPDTTHLDIRFPL